MKKNIKHFIGIDASKSTFDAVLLNENQKEKSEHQVFDNSSTGVKRMLKWLVSNHVNLVESVFCMEHTGIYSFVIADQLADNKLSVWLEMPVRIIRSMGIQRGKNDKIDALKIAHYAFKHRQDMNEWIPPRKEVLKIKDLLVIRELHIKALRMMTHPIGELKDMKQDQRCRYMQSYCKNTIASITKEIKLIEEELMTITKSDEHLSELFSLITSVPGIGMITAWNFIVITNEFTLFKSAKQLACNVGVVPFEHQSGSSIRGRARVSKMAHMNMKRLLHLGALSLIKKDNEFKQYYDRKVAEGKNKMLVINAIRNKLVHRIVAVVHRGTPYNATYKYAA